VAAQIGHCDVMPPQRGDGFSHRAIGHRNTVAGALRVALRILAWRHGDFSNAHASFSFFFAIPDLCSIGQVVQHVRPFVNLAAPG
jgi:hypothetical protein